MATSLQYNTYNILKVTHKPKFI